MQELIKRAGLYCRLSKDDDTQGDSESIKTQKALLTQYAKEHGFIVVDVYVDDGYSGLNFDRPDFNRMLDDIDSGKLDVVITKDLSRLGRDHLKVGYFSEIYFPTKHIRYIAVNDGVDTAYGNNDIAALKNVMNEFYSRDSSRKIRSSVRARAKLGLYRTSRAPLGYHKDPNNRNHLVVDEETAWIIRKIFELASQGWGAHRISTHFRNTHVPCSAWWQHQRGERDWGNRFETPENEYLWVHTVVSNMIKNPVYLGHTVMCKTETIFKVGLQVRTPKEKHIVVENTHEPLVSQTDFDLANEKILSRKREDNSGHISIFSGLLKCGTCGKAMCQSRYPKSRKYLTYICRTYTEFGKDTCSDHRVFYDDLYNAVLSDIRTCAKIAFENREKAIALIQKKKGKTSIKETTSVRSRLKAAEKRLSDLNSLFDRLYEDNLAGRISPANFERLIDKYQSEQKEVETLISQLQTSLKANQDTLTDAENWIDLIRKYVDLQELNAEILNELISKIMIHERKKTDGAVTQDIEIHYRFVGLLDDTEYAAKILPSGAAQRWAKRDGV